MYQSIDTILNIVRLTSRPMTPAAPPARVADTRAGHAPAVPARVRGRAVLAAARAVPQPAPHLAVVAPEPRGTPALVHSFTPPSI